MPIEKERVETLLAVGQPAMFHTEPKRKDSPRYKTALRGWRKPMHIMMDRPKTEQGSYRGICEIGKLFVGGRLDDGGFLHHPREFSDRPISPA